MSRRVTALTAQQILESYDFAQDESSEDEIDLIEKRVDTSEDEENESPLEQDDDLMQSASQDIIDFGSSKNIILGRQTKVKPKPPFEWFDKPDIVFSRENNKFAGEIIEELKNEKSVIFFFKMIITNEMMESIVEYTNLRISLINTSKILNKNYRIKFERMISKKITLVEMYGFVGLMILFGLTGKTDVSVEEIWSEKSIHYSPIASAAMSRQRFQLITQNICFDNILTRNSRNSNKFHKMSDIFGLFKENIKLITPSYCLCVDETLYQFRGKCFCRQFIPSKPARYGIKYWCLVDTMTGKLQNLMISVFN